jgi:hypothetical protein
MRLRRPYEAIAPVSMDAEETKRILVEAQCGENIGRAMMG